MKSEVTFSSWSESNDLTDRQQEFITTFMTFFSTVKYGGEKYEGMIDKLKQDFPEYSFELSANDLTYNDFDLIMNTVVGPNVNSTEILPIFIEQKLCKPLALEILKSK
ncbi:hypothetical protein JFL43_07525 [Viridibacillus sp. YIM B01967]|uniref:Uncharacterized protein n=1 Tax=Viridibacillus soli TaxID=2798301 RepID=A0ABS1H5L6_9BACL|nr:hypothetical protein [Viridibacillus soli]MBK3494709.1 hypothetical protein [Viridibacillus soli]